MADKYVSLSGSDSNAGTLAAPYLTWTKGLQNVGLGDTVYIRGGTYTTAVSNPTSVTFGTQESERITVMPYNNESVTLKPNSGTVCFQLKGNNATNSKISYLTLKDLTFDGSNFNSGSSQLVKIWAQTTSTVEYVTIDGCTFNNAADHALQILDDNKTVTNCTVQNCTVLNAGNNPGSELNSNGMYLIGSNFTIQDNVVGFTNSPASGSNGIRLGANANGQACDNGIIRRNYCYGSPHGIIIGGGADSQIYNNLIRECGTRGIQVWCVTGLTTARTLIYHNTLVHSTGMTDGVDVFFGSGTVTDTDVRNNIIRRATTAVDVSGDTGTPINSNNYTSTAPGFANDGGTAIADYILTGSPATKDAGADLRATVPTDFYLNTRDATPDQGFFEMVDPATPEVIVSASYSGNKGQNITFDPQVTDEDSDALTIYIDRRNNSSLTLTFTAGTSTVEGG